MSKSNEIDLLLVTRYLNHAVFIGPFVIESTCGTAPEQHLVTGIKQFINLVRIKITPWQQLCPVTRQSLQGLLLDQLIGIDYLTTLKYLGRCIEFETTGRVIGRVQLRMAQHRLQLLESSLAAVQKVNVILQTRIINGTLLLLYNVYHAHRAQLLQEQVIFLAVNQEYKFLHLGNHSSASSCLSVSRFSNRDLSIFWLDLERFSSSSMNLFILRMASS